MKPEVTLTCQVCGARVPAGLDFCPVCAFRGALDDARETTEIDVELTDSSPASRFDHYQVLTLEDGRRLELGHGAMGVTYKAIDINLRCAVALKVISARFIGDESARRRFVREARAAASVRHPNVASVFHLGQTGDGYFYAMEFVEGETLENLIKRCGRLEPKIALEIASQVAAGLTAIHAQNLVHRDIKPTNIMVSLKNGGGVIAKIIDLGLAKPVVDVPTDSVISIPGAFAGTPEFASPEQFSGVPVDIRSDLYSLGVTLWEMLTGNAPFRGTPGEVMHQHQHEPLPLERLKDVPQPIVVLLELLLEKDPARRFQSPSEFLKAISTITGAIDARRTRTIRVFVSSPGDVQKERKLADNLIRSVAAEFGIPVSVTYSNSLRNNEIFSTALESDDGTLVLCPYFWEYQRFRPDEGYEEQIPNPAEFDLVICILWSRLGTQLAPKFVLPDGSRPGSGTDYEIAWALYQSNQTRGVPALHVYRNRSTPHFPLEPEDRYKELVDQWRSLKDLCARWGKNSEGLFVGAFNNYLTLDEFEDLFRTHFRDYLLSQLDRGTSHRMLAGKTKRWLENPFRGLEVFEFEHAPIFRGRTKAVGELLDLLIRLGNAGKPFVLVIGASGSGKSSFVRAGVLPLLTEPGIVEGIGLWRRAVARPAAAGAAGDPFDALAAALLDPAALPELADQESASPVNELADELRENPAGVALRVKDALRTAALRWKDRQEQFLRTREEEMTAANRPKDADAAGQQREQLSEPRARLALVVDQLEELFTTGFSPEIQEKYVSAVSGLARSGRVFIIGTLRSDFYARYQEFPELVELAKEGRFDLRPPGAGEIRRIIQQPAEAAGLSFERDPESGESLDEALRDAAIKNPESLPLLQHALDQLFHAQAERRDNLLRWSDYRALRGVEGALAKHAEATFEKLHPHEQGAFPVVMGQLVTLGQGEEEVPNRRSALYSDFSAAEAEGQSRAGAQGFIDLFVKNRLFMADTDASGNVVISVTHEALLRHWTRVREWLAVNREFLRMRDRLDANLQIWKGRGRQKADLLQSGLPLAEGEKLLSDFTASLGPEQSDYIRASIAERHRQRHRRSLVRNGVLALFGLLAVGAGIQWYRAENEAKLAQKQSKAADDARYQADGLINFMLHDLRDKLLPIGRLEVLDDVSKKAKEYLDGLPKEFVTASRLGQQAALLNNLGGVLVAQGKLPEALDAYQRGLAITRRLAERDKADSRLQQDLESGYVNLGDVLAGQGKLPQALESYQQRLAIVKRLVERDKTNSAWRKDLVSSYIRIGDALYDQGKPAEALDSYQQGLAIAKRLAEENKTNTDSQGVLSDAYDRVGDVLADQGKLPEALDSYQQSLNIREKLAQQDKTDSNWQRAVSFSYLKVGDALHDQGKLAEALDADQHCLAIAKSLAEQDKTNTTWQRDLSVTYERVGNVLKAQGKPAEALDAYQQCLQIRQKLTEQDQTNTGWQWDLAVSYEDVGDVLLVEGKLPEALGAYQEDLTIAKRLAGEDKTNNSRQGNLSISFNKVGVVLAAQGKLAEALDAHQQGLAIAKGLAEQDKTNSGWQRNLAISYVNVGDVLVAEAKLPEALDVYRNALAISDMLASQDPSNADWQNAAAWTRYCIAKVLMRIKDGDQEEAKRVVAEGIGIIEQLKHQGALTSDVQQTLNKLNDLAKALDSSSTK